MIKNVSGLYLKITFQIFTVFGMLKTNAELKELFQAHFDTEYGGFIGYPLSAEEFRSVFKACIKL